MRKGFSEWIDTLIRTGIIERYDISEKAYLRVSGPVRFVIPGDKIRELMRQYESQTEKGGFLVAKHCTKNGQSVLTVTEVVFIENISPNPQDSYQFHMQHAKVAVENAFSSQQFPVIFHTHPTKANSFLQEIKEYSDQINTSEPDQVAAASNPYLTRHGRLLLPEALIVCPGSAMNGIFVGLYGGLIAPLDFKKQKHKLLYNSLLNTTLKTLSFINNPKDAAIASGIGLSLATFLKQLSPVNKRRVGEGIQLLPLLSYAYEGDPKYFAMSAGKKLTIDLPKPGGKDLDKQAFFIDNNFG